MRKRKRRRAGGGGVCSLFLSILESPAVRLDISLIFGLFMNLFYISVNLFPAVAYRNAWSLAVTLYYAVLVIMRLSLISANRFKGSVGKDAARLYSSCRLVGRFLLLLDAAIGAVMIYTVADGKIIDYPLYIFIAFGIFTLYSVTGSLVGIFRSLKNSTVHSLAARNLTFAAALLSVFNLEYTLLVTLGVSRRIIVFVNVIGGALCVAFISFMAVRLILISTRKIKETSHV